MPKKHFLFFLLFTLLTPLQGNAEFAKVLQPRPFKVPRSHGAHYRYPTEWWYFTGHLKNQEQQTFGFEVTFFRVGVRQEKAPEGSLLPRSLFIGHFAITDDQGNAFYHEEILERDSLPQSAGASSETLHVWLGNWLAKLDQNTITLKADMESVELSLSMTPRKPVVLHGNKGLSQKGPEPGDASYYSSFTRMEGDGTLSLPGQSSMPVSVEGAWMDHEVLSSNVGPQASGWDWFAIQLDTNQELMLYTLKTESGKASPFSSGSFVDVDGSVTHLNLDGFSIQKLSEWTSPSTKITYPSRWNILVPSLALDITVTPTIHDQELVTKKTTGVTYWEGRSLVAGHKQGQLVEGNAYVELVGYEAQN
jgi:predicted secreted hydrolase